MARTCQSATTKSSVAEDLHFPLLTRFFPTPVVEALLDRHGVASIREGKLPAVFLVYFVIALCLFRHKSMRETQRTLLDQLPLIGGRPRKDLIATRSAFTKARQRLGPDVLPALYAQCVKPLATSETPGAFFHGLRLVAIDGSTLAFTDTPETLAEFSGPGKTKDTASFPMGNLVVLVECGTRVVFGADLGPYTTNESVLARKLLKHLHAGMLCLLDRGYIGYPWLKEAKPTGADFLIRLRGNMELPVLKRFNDGSYLSHILPPYADRKAGARPIRVRVIEYTIAGKDEVYRLLTTLLDPEETSAQELAELYHERWEVETTLREVKAYLRGGSLNTFRSRTPELVRQELYGYLLAHYLVRRAIFDGARQDDVDPDVLSFTHAVSVLTRHIPRLVGHVTRRAMEQLYADFLEELLEERVSSSRGDSVERAVRRYAKYPIRAHGPTSPRHQDFTVTLLPVAA